MQGPLSRRTDQEFIAAAERGAIQVKIGGFGNARLLPDGNLASTQSGMAVYTAPEVITGTRYGAKADLWSLGVIGYECLTGRVPFQKRTPNELKIFYEENIDLRPDIPPETSPELADLLLQLLKRNAKDRIGFYDLTAHPFLGANRPRQPERTVTRDFPTALSRPEQNTPIAASNDQSSSTKKWYTLGGGLSKSFQKYEVDLRLWSDEADLPWTRHEAGACIAANRLILFGGLKDGTYNNNSEIDDYGLLTETWQKSSIGLREGRCNLAVCSDGQDAYTIGGWNFDDCSVVERYNPVSNRITELTHLTSPRYSSAAVFVSNSIYVAGGSNNRQWLDCIEKYDITASKWSPVGSLSAGRRDLAATLCGEDLYLAGGNTTGSFAVNTVEIFNIRTGQTRSAPTDLQEARKICYATTIDNGNVICVLGSNSCKVETYDVREGKWSNTGAIVPDMPKPVEEGFMFAAY